VFDKTIHEWDSILASATEAQKSQMSQREATKSEIVNDSNRGSLKLLLERDLDRLIICELEALKLGHGSRALILILELNERNALLAGDEADLNEPGELLEQRQQHSLRGLRKNLRRPSKQTL